MSVIVVKKVLTKEQVSKALGAECGKWDHLVKVDQYIPDSECGDAGKVLEDAEVVDSEKPYGKAILYLHDGGFCVHPSFSMRPADLAYAAKVAKKLGSLKTQDHAKSGIIEKTGGKPAKKGKAKA